MAHRFGCLVFFLSFFAYGSYESFKTLELELGEVRTLLELNDAKINLSKKGIVLANFGSKRQWQLVGHRKGFVVLSYYDGKAKESKKILITVKNTKEKIEKHSSLPWFCLSETVECLENPLRVKGYASSWQLYYQMENWIKSHKNSSSFIEMTESAQKALKRKLDQIIPKYGVLEVGPHGLKSLLISCDLKEEHKSIKVKNIKNILKSIQISTVPEAFCRHKVRGKSFEVKARVFLLSEDKEDLSGGASIRLSELIDVKNHKKLLTKMESLEKKNHLRIIGEPKISVREGVQSISQTGGEFSYIKESDLSRRTYQSQGWKSYGLKLKTRVVSINEKKAQVFYDLSLSLPSSGTNTSSVRSTRLSGEQTITLGKKSILAVTSYDRKDDKIEEDSFWKKIPFLSIFFSRKRQENLFSYLFFSLVVKEL